MQSQGVRGGGGLVVAYSVNDQPLQATGEPTPIGDDFVIIYVPSGEAGATDYSIVASEPRSVAVLETSMLRADWPERLRHFRAAHPRYRVAVLSTKVHDLWEAANAGADWFPLRRPGGPSLQDAIRQLLDTP